MNVTHRFLLRDDLIYYLFLLLGVVDAFILFKGVELLINYNLLSVIFTKQVEFLFSWNLMLSWTLSILFVTMFLDTNLNSSWSYLRTIFSVGFIYGIILLILLPVNPAVQITLEDAGTIFYSSFSILFIYRTGFYFFYKIFTKTIRKTRYAIIIGHTNGARQLINRFKRYMPRKIHILGIFDDNSNSPELPNNLYTGSLSEVKSYCLDNQVDEIYYTLPNHKAFINELRDFCDENFIFFGILPDLELNQQFILKTQLLEKNGVPLLSFQRSPLAFSYNRYLKRILDISFSLIVLIILSISLFPLIALAIKIDSKGPVFFKQLRSGLNCKPFYCYKFRTMKLNDESDTRQASKYDNRITRLGRFLRKTSLDELPQFWNVLKGDMSIVGPRPHMLMHTEAYTTLIEKYKTRHYVDSGITGYAQVNGYRGETKDISLMEKRILHDNWYLENWSLGLDFKIIARTALNIFKGDKNAV